MANAIEEAASKLTGKAKEGMARVQGLRGVFAKLAEEHGQVATLLKRVQASDDPEVRARLFPEIRRELLSHEKGELGEVYPALRKYEETRAFAEAHDNQADELERTLSELSALDASDEAWTETFDALVALVEEHVKDEEGTYFPAAMKVLDDTATAELQRRYVQAKGQAAKALG